MAVPAATVQNTSRVRARLQVETLHTQCVALYGIGFLQALHLSQVSASACEPIATAQSEHADRERDAHPHRAPPASQQPPPSSPAENASMSQLPGASPSAIAIGIVIGAARSGWSASVTVTTTESLPAAAAGSVHTRTRPSRADLRGAVRGRRGDRVRVLVALRIVRRDHGLAGVAVHGLIGRAVGSGPRATFTPVCCSIQSTILSGRP